MPRFTEQEKKTIEHSLLVEGKRLFTMYGLKKVTIDDIIQAVNIAKASFYKFYEGKEYLFLDIVQRDRQEIFEALEVECRTSQASADEERIKELFRKMFVLSEKYPLISSIDEKTIEILKRKVSLSQLEAFLNQGNDTVRILQNYGINFKYSTRIISQLFLTLYQAWISLQGSDKTMQKQVMDIMLDGIIHQIV